MSSAKKREASFIAAIGMVGVGKSYENLQQICRVLLGVQQKGVPPRKVLILDNNLEYHNNSDDVRDILGRHGLWIKTIHYRDTPIFSRQRHVEACRIVPIDKKGRLLPGKDFAKMLAYVLKHFKGGLIIAEDFKAIAGGSLNDELIGQLNTRRHKGCDTIVSLQGLNMIHPQMLTALKWIRLHKSLDPFERSEKFKGKETLLKISENLVNNRYKHGGQHERFYVKIDLQRSIIVGRYTKQEFSYAAQQYIFENYAATVGLKMKWRNPQSGQKIFTEQTALQEVLNEIESQYSQYSKRYEK